MEIGYLKETYPCGMIIEQRKFKLNIINLIIPTLGFKDIDGCPLHGKNCTKMPYLGKKKK